MVLEINWAKPLTEDQELSCQELFKKMPTFRMEGIIQCSDLPQLFDEMNYKYTPEQMKTYLEYYNKYGGGYVRMGTFNDSIKVLYDTSKVSKIVAATFFDKDGNGFIDEDEFEEFSKYLKNFDPKLEQISFEEFVETADTNKDGRISVEEFSKWLETHQKA